jgi:hypothetical protein
LFRFCCQCLALCVALWGSHALAPAAEVLTADEPAAQKLTVRTQLGRIFIGRLDPLSTHQTLVLRSGSYDMHVLRPIDWDQITELRVDGQPSSPDMLLRQLDSSGWPPGPESLPVPPAPELPAPSETRADVRTPAPSRVVPVATQYDEPQPLPVATLYIDAWAGKWSWGADNDGIFVRIFPLDQYGNLVPVNGTLEVDLIGTQYATFTRGEPFPPLAHWAQIVSPDDMHGNGAVYRFPYQAYQPEFDLQFGSLGIVHARLSVPGQGVFDDTATMVRVRPYSSTRDRLQMHRGGRFFPNERTQRGMNDSSGWPH